MEKQQEADIISKIKDSIKIYPICDKTLVFAVISDIDDPSNNKTKSLKCPNGTPIGGYPYDTKQDCYYVECVEVIELGVVPFAFRLTIQDCGVWQTSLPLPESVIRQSAETNAALKKNLSLVDAKYVNKNKYKISFVQMDGCD